MKEKLVRDNMPVLCAQDPNKTPMKYRLAGPGEMAVLLTNKLAEEVTELSMAIHDDFGRKDGADILEELADVQEVLDTLRRRGRWTAADVKNVQIRKRAERGGFKKGIVWDGQR